MQVRMDGRIALVTGASLGLGKAMALKFAESGASVALIARGRDGLEAAKAEIAKATGAKVGAYSCDVSKLEPIQAAWSQITRDFGQVDILVNNAGHSTTGPFESLTDAIWQDDFDLKVFAAIRFARLALPGMKARRWGRIINVLNTQAKAPGPGSAPTSVARAAGMALTKVLAGEGAPHNVLVNCLMTGSIVSDQVVRRHAQEGGNMSLEQFIAERGKSIPIGRMGTAEEFANMACFLASEQGSYITGTAINVDGNRSVVV
jgi:3-oxoacyl-[acyl-carrier protein] reductase